MARTSILDREWADEEPRIKNMKMLSARSDAFNLRIPGVRHLPPVYREYVIGSSTTFMGCNYYIDEIIRMSGADRPEGQAATRVFESLELCTAVELEMPEWGSSSHFDPWVRAFKSGMPSFLTCASNLGHIILSDRANYDTGLAALVNFDFYKHSLGGADDIFSFGEEGIIRGCPVRTRRLRGSASIGKPSYAEYRLLRMVLGQNTHLRYMIKAEDRWPDDVARTATIGDILVGLGVFPR
jgi:hypothetical protein